MSGRESLFDHGRRQVTQTLGPIRRHGVTWHDGDKFRYRTWLGLKFIDPEAARLYFRTTHG